MNHESNQTQLIESSEFLSYLISSSPDAIKTTMSHINITKPNFSEINDILLSVLLNLKKEGLCPNSAINVVGENYASTEGNNYGIKISEESDETGLKKIAFFNIKRSLIPITIDLLSLTLAILTIPSTAVIPAVSLIVHISQELTTIERENGGEVFLRAYEAILKAKLKDLKTNTEKTDWISIENIFEYSSNKNINELSLALSTLEAKKILQSKNGEKIFWKECW